MTYHGTRRLKYAISIYLTSPDRDQCTSAAITIMSDCHLWGDAVLLARAQDDWETIAVIDEVAVADRARWIRRRLFTASEILKGRLDERITSTAKE